MSDEEQRDEEPTRGGATVVDGASTVDDPADEGTRVVPGGSQAAETRVERRAPEVAPDASEVPADDDSEASTVYVEPPASVAGPGATPSAGSPGDADATVYGDEAELPAPSGLTPGSVLFGEYEIVDVLGAGGMGEVYRARHRRLDEMRAIKVMHSAFAEDPTAAELFDREAKALLSVRHPAVVHCHDLLSDAGGAVYLVMEMIDGIALSDRIRNAPLEPEEVRTLGARVASGLAAAHARGVIHRDLSPDNIVLPGGRPEEAKLIDFGIAKVLASGQQTIMEGFKGKLAFASPEQLGFFDGAIDGRSDIYSLGLVLYAAATGRLLPMGTTVADAVDSRRNLAGLPRDCPRELRGELEPLLAFDPADRPASAEGLFGGAGRVARASPGRREGPIDRRPLVAGAGLVAVLAMVGVGWLAWPEPSAPPQAEPVAIEEPEVAPPEVKPAEPKPEVTPPKPKPKPGPSRTAKARQQLRVVGLLRGADAALARGQLTAPPGENAYEKYREVLKLDSRNQDARDGVQRVAGRLIEQSRSALAADDAATASARLDEARKISPRHPDLAAATEALKSASP